MSQVNNRVFRVGTVVPSTSFQLEGENTTDYGTFTSGTYQTITFGTALSTITNVTASGGNARKVEDTTIHTDQVSQIPTVFEPIVYDMESQWIPGDAGLVALVSASANKQERAVRFSFADGRKSVFNAIPAVSFVPTGTAHDKVITPLSFDARARPTAYAT
jgi:hypothetical protein